MGKITGLISIYWGYSFSMWEKSSNCDGSSQHSVQLGPISKDGFSEGDLYSCVSDQFKSFPNNATLYLTSLDSAETFSYSTFQCKTASDAKRGCDDIYSKGCTNLVTDKGKVGICAQLGTSASFMLTRSVSNAFYGIVFGTIGFALIILLCSAYQRGWRLRGGHCVKVDLDAEAEASYWAEQQRRAEMQASFDRAKKNPMMQISSR